MLSSATVLQAKVKVKTVGDYEYTYHDIKQNKIWITKITPKKTVSSTKLNIPSKIDGKKVYKLGSYSDIKRNDSDVANLFGLEFDEDNGAGYMPKDIVEKVEKIEIITIPSSVKKITARCFGNMPDGKTISIPYGITKNVRQFCNISQWKKVNISKKNKKYKIVNGLLLSKSGKKTYGYTEMKERITIPPGVEEIVSEAFKGVTYSKSIYFPKSLKKIGGSAFNYCSIQNIKISSKNKKYASASGCVYERKSGKLVIAGAVLGKITMPSKVKSVGKELSVIGGGLIKEIIFSKNLKKIGAYWHLGFGDKVVSDNLIYRFRSKIPPKVSKYAIFKRNAKVYVPEGCVQSYKYKFSNYFEWIYR